MSRLLPRVIDIGLDYLDLLSRELPGRTLIPIQRLKDTNAAT